MQGTLLVAILTVRSSYLNSLELPLAGADEVPDTLQWWIAGLGTWRIKTFAIDHDIHTHRVDTRRVEGNEQELLALARENNRKHYGDVIKAEYSLNFADCCNRAEVNAEFQRAGLEAHLEVADERFAFWKPDEARYSTKSNPSHR